LVLLFLLTVVVLCGVIPQAVWLPLGLFYDLLDEEVEIPTSAIRTVTFHVWVLVGPLVFVNLCWLAYAVCRWRRPSPRQLSALANEAGKLLEAMRTPGERGSSAHVQPQITTLKDPL
jgi:hypothetical protein